MKRTVQVFLALYLVLFNISTLYAMPYDDEIILRRPQAPDISATAAIVMDAQTGFILYEKNIHEPRYPASLTKIMTALLALEQYANRLYEPILFSNNAVYSIPRNSSHIAMNEGETLTVENALYGILLASANEVANAIAEHIGEDIQSFGTLMTRRAAALGAINTQFKNPSGLHDPEQMTTAYDMAIITREALRYPKFTEIISTIRHDIPPTERQPQIRELLNTNQMIQPGQHFNQTVVGGKTGFTSHSRHTLATYAATEDRRLIVVTLQSEGSHLYADTKALLDYGFGIPYNQQLLFYQNQYAQTVPVFSDWSPQGNQVGEVRLVVPDDVYLTLPLGFDISDVEHTFYIPGQLTVPIQAGQNIGRVSYTMHGIPMGDISLRATNTILPTVVAETSIAEDTFVAEDAPGTEATASQESIIPENPESLSGPGSRSYEHLHFSLEELAENYYLSFFLPLAIFCGGLVLSIGIFKIQRRRKQARLGHYSVIGSQIRRYRR